ncbi:nitroreductase family protein [Candidatus Bipolaricaulota bacterium]
MNVYEAIAARRTIRDFAPRRIARDTLFRILGAGLQAPTHDHLRQWKFILVEDTKQREALVNFFRAGHTESELEAMLDGWNMTVESQRDMYLDAIPKQARMIRDAGALVIPCFHQPSPILEKKTSLHELNAFASMWAVVENILIAAAGEGIHGVTKVVSTPDETAHIRQALHMPNDYEVPCYLALGYPACDCPSLNQVPIAPRDRIFVGRWSA